MDDLFTAEAAAEQAAAQLAENDPHGAAVIAGLYGLEAPSSARQSASNLDARFEMRAMRDPIASKAAGRDIFKDRLYLVVTNRLDPGSTVERPAFVDGSSDTADNVRFARAYKNFLAGKKGAAEGTPLAVLKSTTPPMLNNVQEAELAAKPLYVRTVEQLAALPDEALRPFTGWGLKARNAAKQFLAIAKATEPQRLADAAVATMRAENEELRKRLADLEALVEKATTPSEPARVAGG
jgi:hypothetical protein